MDKIKHYINWKIISWIVGVIGGLWTLLIGLILLILLLVVVVIGLNDSGSKSGCSVDDSPVASDVSDKGKKLFEQNAKGGELDGKVNAAIKIAKEEKVPPSLFLAIMASESGWGKSANATNQHNPLSIMGSGPLRNFDSIEDGMRAGAKNLYDLYISKGLDTPAKIQPKYAPNGASNDPTDLNSNWKRSVESIQKQMSDGKSSGSSDIAGTSGDSGNCSMSSSSVTGGGSLTALSKFKGSLPTPKNKTHAMRAAQGNLYTYLECTWYVYNRRKELGIPISTFWGDAGRWANNAKRDGYAVGKKPVKGACVTWPIQGGMPYGHVAFVEGVSKNGKTIHVSEYNWAPKVHSYGERTIKVQDQMQFIYDKKGKK